MAFTAHNIRLADGTETFPSRGYTMERYGLMISTARLLALLFPDGLAGRSIIDVGCLEGGYATEFARLGMLSIGLEARGDNYANCLYVQDHVGLPTLRFIQGDANDMERYGGYDVFFVNGLLYHLERPRRFLEAAGRNCGRAIILDTHFSSAEETDSVSHFGLSELTENEGLPGRWFAEKGDTPQWHAYGNQRSFWIQKEHLLSTLNLVGFDLVFEQFDYMVDIGSQMEDPSWKRHSRGVFVGVKTSR